AEDRARPGFRPPPPMVGEAFPGGVTGFWVLRGALRPARGAVGPAVEAAGACEGSRVPAPACPGRLWLGRVESVHGGSGVLEGRRVGRGRAGCLALEGRAFADGPDDHAAPSAVGGGRRPAVAPGG